MAHAYYNESNPEAAAMLRQMMADGLIVRGVVDERSITEVSPDDLNDFTQCHFFAGIGGWPLALRAAGWPDDQPVWTGSAPCQPFSAAGRQKGKDDERHLFPVWLDLIRERGASIIFGEQAATSVAHGWLDDVYQGLEAEGYAVGAAILPACSVGAPHLRERLWFVADASLQRGGRLPNNISSEGRSSGDATQPDECGASSVVDNTYQPRLERYGGHDGTKKGWEEQVRPTPPTVFWDNAGLIPCYDGKYRFVEPSIPLLADGVLYRGPLLHALGNAIVPQVAEAFIRSFMEIQGVDLI